ncbi:ester cyclase [Nocardioides panzhihuensis]|uniref:Putative ester cyclase n=1 Tax=Nocardioides panzhihuensis TaxID=860243 RepID=A0A7Z0DPA1_9ACTN|nr:ester cyclase [Nocardioides panzhihuensis]NYI78909.1 putative ester cyclase [Nocardioides panzhihuensis]
MPHVGAPEPTLDPSAHRPFASVEEYILRCTDEIWVDRGVGLIDTAYYDPEVRIHGAFGTSVGLAPVLAGTTQSIASYPDEVGFGEDVVWEPRGSQSFISSHRVYSTGTNTGWTSYGPPSGRHFEKRALAHCLVKDGKIIEEWVVRDEHRLVTDLGHDPHEVARRFAERGDWQPLELGDLPEDPIRTGVSGVRDSETAPAEGQRIVEMFDQMWNARRLDRISDFYDRDVVLHTSRGRTLQGLRQVSTETLDMLAAFPDAQQRILDVCIDDHPQRGQRAAVVWLLEGTYSGYDVFGPATGLPIQLLGASQLVLEHGRIVREFRVYDELALAIQIEQGRLRSTTAGS